MNHSSEMSQTIMPAYDVYPVQHKVYNHEEVAGKYTTMEMFKSNGYYLWLCEQRLCGDRWNLTKAFRPSLTLLEQKGNNAKYVVKSAKKFIKKRKGKPFYLCRYQWSTRHLSTP